MKLWQTVVISKLYTNINNLEKIPYKYLVNTLFKPKNLLFSFISLNYYTKKSMQILPKKLFMTKHRILGATNLRQPRKLYTAAGCDGWAISKVCLAPCHFVKIPFYIFVQLIGRGSNFFLTFSCDFTNLKTVRLYQIISVCTLKAYPTIKGMIRPKDQVEHVEQIYN